MSERVLVVLLAGREIGRVRQDRRGRLTFAYDEAWRTLEAAYPLSLSMPLAAARHRHDRIDAFLWGLLPDNQQILDSWATRFHVSARNAFSLMSEVGEDCAGAVQFVRPDRVEDVAASDVPEVEWLGEDEVAERLAALRRDSSAWRSPGDTGQFSLAGAQAKTALLLEDRRWGIPSGRTATSHILKPPMGDLEGTVENEHLCLQLAREVGLPTASSEVRRFGSEVAIVIERYDRTWAAGQLLRIHQEDLCQALGIHPRNKYQNEGGPSPEQIVDLLRDHSSRPEEDVATFIDALAFNWLIGGTDAHAKNYSILHSGRGRVRLAPLYDIISALPYAALDFERLKLAMKIGGSYRIRDIWLHRWRSFAQGLRLQGSTEVIERVSGMASRVLERSDAVRAEVTGQGLTHSVIGRLTQSIKQRSERCLELLSDH